MKRIASRLPAVAILAALAAATGPGAPARAASMDPFLEQQQTEQALNQAVMLYSQGEYDEAEKVARNYLRFDPSSPKGHEVLGAVLAKKGEIDAAMESLDMAVRLDPNQPAPHINRAVLLMGLDRIEEARESLETAVELDPAMLPARERLGRVYEILGRYDAAIEQYEAYVDASDESGAPGVRLNLAKIGRAHV